MEALSASLRSTVPTSSSWLGFCSDQTMAAAQRASRVFSGPCCSLYAAPACTGLSHLQKILLPELSSGRACGLRGDGVRSMHGLGAKRVPHSAYQGDHFGSSLRVPAPGDGRKGLLACKGEQARRECRSALPGHDRLTGSELRAQIGAASISSEQGNGWEREIVLAGEGAYGAIATAFSTMVFMLRAIQNYAMHLRQHLSPLEKHDIQELMNIVQREMHSSLLWLFQTVFSATPVLMVSVMLLLANFTVHSAGSLAPAEAAVLDLLSVSPIAQGLAQQEPVPQLATSLAEDASVGKQTLQPFVKAASRYRSGGQSKSVLRDWGVNASPAVQGAAVRGEEEASTSESCGTAYGAKQGGSPSSLVDTKIQDRLYMQGLLEQAAKEMELEVPYHHVRLDQEVIRQLVAPLSVEVDPDNYACFDRTELQYLGAIAKEPSNALLLGNMAMFMYVVRKDKER
jgi:hypothetical protein